MVVIDGHSLTVEDVIEVALGKKPVTISEQAVARMQDCRAKVMAQISRGDTAYGINTGFGALCTTSIAAPALKELQQNLVRSHASGVGPFFPEEVVRGAMLLRANNLSRGQSGAREQVALMLAAMLNAGITPAVREKGSLGASGDLAPLADLALVMMGEGNAFVDGKMIPGSEALARAGLTPLSFEAKEGLALLNGTAFMTTLATLACYRAKQLIAALNGAAALSLVAMKGHVDAFSEQLVGARPHHGAVQVAKSLRHLLAHISNLPFAENEKIQDPYSFRCTPQVHGALVDALNHAWNVVSVELNATTDNPLVLDGRVVSGGNFHGQPIGAVMDYLAIATTSASAISERRVNQMLHPFQSRLPAFLAVDPGLNSGLMIAQYTASALVNENRVLSNPASVQSTPVSADQEDHVSMATLAANKALSVVNNSIAVAAVELLSAAQAFDLRCRSEGYNSEVISLASDRSDGDTPRVDHVYDLVRSRVPFIEKDCILTPFIEELCCLIRNGVLVG